MYIYISFLGSFIATSIYCFNNDFSKIDESHSYDAKLKQYTEILPTVLFNSFVLVPLCSIPFSYILPQEFNISYFLLTFMLSYIMSDIFFYIAHRIMHIPLLYKWSHKQHHKYKLTVGIEALYLHWFDLYFGNILPFYLPLLILKWDLISSCIWTIIIVSRSVYVHGTTKNDHLTHHKLFVYNYSNSYTDILMNTYKKKEDVYKEDDVIELSNEEELSEDKEKIYREYDDFIGDVQDQKIKNFIYGGFYKFLYNIIY